MCDRCADIDYPIGDVIWLPCGGPTWRYHHPGYRHRPVRRPDDTQERERVARIFREIRRPEPPTPVKGFEGIEA